MRALAGQAGVKARVLRGYSPFCRDAECIRDALIKLLDLRGLRWHCRKCSPGLHPVWSFLILT
jgi:hypothetical protein